MNCPIDGTTLAISDRSGIEIDYCPQCRGVWLDRGELDKLIERDAAQSAPTPPPPAPRPEAVPYGRDDRYDDDRRRYYGDDDDDDRWRGGGRKRKKRGMLGDLFDFD